MSSLILSENKIDSRLLSATKCVVLYGLTIAQILPASVAQLDGLSDWRPGGRGFSPRRSQQHSFVDGLGGSVGCAVRLETRRSRVQPPLRSANFFHGDWS